ncbi:MAG TPA: GNAT family N-acetyltransferase [Pyrinomonadaceae bacterium]|jgi:RimJ/RimL family protein N-acetyltransferase
MYKFRKLEPEDFPLMLKWLSENHVREWWNDGDDTLEKVALHYGERSEDVRRFILIQEKEGVEKSIGYFQYYFASGGEIGIDQFIGEKDYLGKGVGEKAIRLFIELIIRVHNPKHVILDPSPENKRAIRCYEKVGFVHFETRQNENGEPAYMMRLKIGALHNLLK